MVKKYKLAIVGATGLVGRTALKVLEERNLPNFEYKLFCSKKSAGTKINFMGKEYIANELTETSFDEGFDFAIFSAGGETSKKFAPIAASKGCIYQAVSGAGKNGLEDLLSNASYQDLKKFPHPIHNNCLPHIDVFMEDGYTKEEHKMIDETKKILGDSSIRITATTVRVPVENCHGESINVEFENDFDLEEVKSILKNSEGIILYDDPENNIYPLASVANGRDEVFVGRLRRDYSQTNTLNFWCVADNIRKGAATNAIQIMEKMI